MVQPATSVGRSLGLNLLYDVAGLSLFGRPSSEMKCGMGFPVGFSQRQSCQASKLRNLWTNSNARRACISWSSLPLDL